MPVVEVPFLVEISLFLIAFHFCSAVKHDEKKSCNLAKALVKDAYRLFETVRHLRSVLSISEPMGFALGVKVVFEEIPDKSTKGNVSSILVLKELRHLFQAVEMFV